MYPKKLADLRLRQAMKAVKPKPKRESCENCGQDIGRTIIACEGKIICVSCWEFRSEKYDY